VGRDLVGGILLCVILRGTYHLLWWGLCLFLSRKNYVGLVHTETAAIYNAPSDRPEYFLLAVMCLVSGFFQELVMRAYLIVRLEELFESTAVAFLLSTILFVCYHGYQGTAGVIGVVLFGVIQGIAFCAFRRLAPISIAHAVTNFIAIGRVRWL